MEKINLAERLNFNNEDLTAPNLVVKDIAEQIEKQTGGIIVPSVDEYHISSEIKSSHDSKYRTLDLSPILRIDTSQEDIDVQKSLGKFTENDCQYDFYLTTPVFKQYKYRICIIQYNASYYPVKVILEESIAYEINSNGTKGQFVYICKNRSELEELITRAICSDKMIGIMQELINIYNIHKDDDKIINTKTSE